MKLIWPLVSRIAHWTSEMWAICSSGAPPRRSPRRVSRSRLRFRSIDLPVLDDDQRLALEHRPRAREAVREPRDADLEHGDRPDDEDGAGERVVVLGQPLLERVAEDDQQDQVERLEAPELALADHARQQHHEAEDEDCAEDEIHLREDRDRAVDVREHARPVEEVDVLRPVPGDVRRVHLELHEEEVSTCPAGMCPSVKASRPSSLPSPIGDGSIVLMLMPSAQPGSSTSCALRRSRLAVMWKRASMKSPPRIAVGA